MADPSRPPALHGRWPVGTCVFARSLADSLSRFPFHHGRDDAAEDSIDDIVDRADAPDPETALGWFPDGADDEPALIDLEVEATEQVTGVRPSDDEVRAALGDAPTAAALDRWLLGWEDERPEPKVAVDGHLAPWTPEGLPTAIVLVPTDRSWEVPAYMSFFGAEGPGGAEALIAVLRSWHERFRAELVAHFDVTLELTVARPPTDIEVAWQLAREQETVAPCTTLLPGVSRRHHARALVGRSTWSLFERP